MEQNLYKKEHLILRTEIAKEADWEAVKKLRLEAVESEDAYMLAATLESVKKEKDRNKEDWLGEMFGNDGFVILSWDGLDAIGMGHVKKAKGERVWYVASTYVKPEFRSRGVGPKIFTVVFGKLLSEKATKVTFMVRRDNLSMIKFTEKMGAKKVDLAWENKEGLCFNMELDLTDEEVIKKIREVLNAR